MAAVDSQIQVKLFNGCDLALLERHINEWLLSEPRPIVQRSQFFSDGSQFVVSIWYEQPQD